MTRHVELAALQTERLESDLRRRKTRCIPCLRSKLSGEGRCGEPARTMGRWTPRMEMSYLHSAWASQLYCCSWRCCCRLDVCGVYMYVSLYSVSPATTVCVWVAWVIFSPKEGCRRRMARRTIYVFCTLKYGKYGVQRCWFPPILLDFGTTKTFTINPL